MYNLDKKGMSSAVSAVFIILLSITAVISVGITINQFLKQPSLSPTESCLNLELKSPIKIEKACFNSTTSETEVTLTRSLEELQISSLRFSLNNSQFECSNMCGVCSILAKGETKKYYFSSSANNVSTSVNGCLLSSASIQGC